MFSIWNCELIVVRFSLSKSCWISPKLCTHVSNTENLHNYYQKKYMLKKSTSFYPGQAQHCWMVLIFISLRLRCNTFHHILHCAVKLNLELLKTVYTQRNVAFGLQNIALFTEHFHSIFSRNILRFLKLKIYFRAQVQLALNPYYSPSWSTLPTNKLRLLYMYPLLCAIVCIKKLEQHAWSNVSLHQQWSTHTHTHP